MRGLVVHQDARYVRNRECLKGLNNVLCVIGSCIKMHATIWNDAPRSVQLVAQNRKSRTEVESVVHQDARYALIVLFKNV